MGKGEPKEDDFWSEVTSKSKDTEKQKETKNELDELIIGNEDFLNSDIILNDTDLPF